jgi:hypothetical protein
MSVGDRGFFATAVGKAFAFTGEENVVKNLAYRGE